MVLLILSLIFISSVLVVFSTLNSGSTAWEKYTVSFTESADNNLRRLFLFTDAKRLFIVYILALILVPLALFVFDVSVLVIVGVAAAIYLFPKWYFKRLARTRREKINAALPDALQQISGAMRAGQTFSTAIQAMVEEQKGPLGQEFSVLLREQRLGARLEEALDNLGERVQTEEMDLVISAALISQEVGGNLAEILYRLSETIRKKMEMEGKVKALTSQGVLQGYVVTALPFMIMFALMFLEPEAIRPLFHSVLGWLFLAVILVLQIVGGAMIKKIVAIEI